MFLKSLSYVFIYFILGTFSSYPYNNNSANSNNSSNYNFTQATTINDHNNQLSPTIPNPTTNQDYIKDFIEKLSDRERNEKHLDPKSYPMYQTNDYNNNNTNTYTNNVSDVENVNNVATDGKLDMIKRSNFLSKIYKLDGTPIKSLWDSETMLKEQRTYKYDPKPLERRKNPRSFVPEEKKTTDYWEKRRKNNIAARKSREDRRRKEIEILKNVDNLKSDNLKLKIYAQKILAENQSLKYEVDLLKRM